MAWRSLFSARRRSSKTVPRRGRAGQRDAQRAAARGTSAGTKARLIELHDVTLSMRLHGLGINSLDELHAGCGELLSAEQVELIYARPGWAWSGTDSAHVRRLLREVADDVRAKAVLDGWREHGVPMRGEIALVEQINAGRRKALGMLSRGDSLVQGR